MSGPVMSEATVHDAEMGNEEVKGASQPSSGAVKQMELGKVANNDDVAPAAPSPLPHSEPHLPTPQSSLNNLPSSPAPIPDSLRSRRSSQFQPTRPAPPSPAPSRRASQIHSPALSSRDRASSTSSSAAMSTSGSGSGSGVSRKLSQSQGLGHRNSLAGKARPRSSLGTAMYIGQSEEVGLGLGGGQEGDKDKASGGDGSGNALDIPSSTSTTDHSGLTTTSPSPSRSTALTPSSPSAFTPSRKPSIPSLIIRDYAFPASDDRYHGLSNSLPADQSSSSSRLSSYLSSTLASDRRLSASAEKKDKERGWGFSLLGWRGFMGRKSRSNSRSSDTLDNHSGSGGYDHSEPDLATAPAGLGAGDEDDDYAFESSSEDDEEPYGLYRAAYPFEPEGEHEIGLEEGEIVEVKGRGGGEGWVVAVKLKSGAGVGVGQGEAVEGLVPEGYLEKVSEEELRLGHGQRRTVAPDGISEEPEETSDLESGPGR